jgi:hypothetical protein
VFAGGNNLLFVIPFIWLRSIYLWVLPYYSTRAVLLLAEILNYLLPHRSSWILLLPKHWYLNVNFIVLFQHGAFKYYSNALAAPFANCSLEPKWCQPNVYISESCLRIVQTITLKPVLWFPPNSFGLRTKLFPLVITKCHNFHWAIYVVSYIFHCTKRWILAPVTSQCILAPKFFRCVLFLSQ